MTEREQEIKKEDLVTLEGTVEDIIYRNSENGYTVLEMECEGDDIPKTVVGIIPGISEGEIIKVMGKWDIHPTYGKQLKVEYYERQQPVGKSAILRYLSSRVIKGIGPKTAKKIVDRFGDDTLTVLENTPEYLADIDGISYNKAVEIGKSYAEQFGMRNVMMFASEFFGMATAIKIYKRWGSSAIDVIKQNPYSLCGEINGVGFVRADKVALSMGTDLNSPVRVQAGMKYVLEFNASGNGHTFIPTDKLIEATANLLEVSKEDSEAAYDALISSGELIQTSYSGVDVSYLKEYYQAEKYICEKLDLLDKTRPPLSVSDIEIFLSQTEYEMGITYAPMQKRAIISAITSGVMILTGGPGTGKTTIIRAVIDIYKKTGLRVALAAPTGRAAKRMSEATGQEAKTIHRMLEMEFGGEKPVFHKNKDDLLEENVIIIDESSMVDTLLLKSLLEAVKPGSSIILIGDADQLPSVGAGNILNDLIVSDRFCTIKLKEIFRQAKMSRIITNAHAINSGEYPVLSDKGNDFFFMSRENDKDILDTIVALCAYRLPKTYGDEIRGNIQVISPSKKGVAGTQGLNLALQNQLNPPSPRKRQKKMQERVFRQGDKVMQIKNNYDLCWTKDGKEGSGVFNGDIGVILDVVPNEEKIIIDFDGRVVEYDYSMTEELEHAYAITIHKSQGSEYPVVIIPVYKYTPRLLTRELLYTAVTRAKNMVILVGSEQVVYQMVDNNRRPKRYTGLKYLMEKYMSGN